MYYPLLPIIKQRKSLVIKLLVIQLYPERQPQCPSWIDCLFCWSTKRFHNGSTKKKNASAGHSWLFGAHDQRLWFSSSGPSSVHDWMMVRSLDGLLLPWWFSSLNSLNSDSFELFKPQETSYNYYMYIYIFISIILYNPYIFYIIDYRL